MRYSNRISAWLLFLVMLITIGLSPLVACSWLHKGYPTSPAANEQEFWVLSENNRFAKQLNVRVEGKLTDYVYVVKAGTGGCPAEPPIDCIAAGFYVSGTAYYYKPWIDDHDFSYGTAIAAHEVCHAKFYNHDAQHAACVKALDPVAATVLQSERMAY
jgi:hypothetical protein